MRLSPFNWLALAFFGYFFAYGVLVPYLPVWVKSHAYDPQFIGIILSSSYFFRFIGSFFFGRMIKHSHQLFTALRLIAWSMVGMTCVMALTAQNFWWLFVSIGIFSMLNAAGMPLTDSLAATWQKQLELDYGKARLLGSLAFTLALVAVGQLIRFTGEQNIIWILTALFVFYSLLLMLNPHPKPHDEAESAGENSVNYWTLLKNADHARMLLAAFLIQGSHAGYYVYSILYWNENGIPVQLTSLLWGCAVTAEILLFFFSKRLFGDWSVRHLMLLATLAAVIRWAAYGSTTSILWLTLLQTFHALTFAVMHIAMIRYIARQPQNTIVKLQSLYSGLANCLGVAVMTMICGKIYPLSPQAMFITMSALVAIAFFVIPRKI